VLPELEPVAGKYEILRKLNEGGMGAIYLVRHRLLDEQRVVKVLRPQIRDEQEFRDRFLREARTAIQLRHPNVAQLYEFEVDKSGVAYMVLEFIDGRTIEDLINSRSRLPLGIKVEIALQTLRALAFLHRKGFVHRDIAPDNIMLTRDPEGGPLVKLLDLGIVKVASNSQMTATAVFLGKIRYASPEQLESSKIDYRSDLYSFGVLLYELLTGMFPIPGDDMRSIMSAHLFKAPIAFADSDPLDEIPGELRALVLHALEKRPERRIQSADDFADRLRALAIPMDPDWDLAHLPVRLDRLLRERRDSQERPSTTQHELDAHFEADRRTPSFPVLHPSTEEREAEFRKELTRAQVMLGRGELERAESAAYALLQRPGIGEELLAEATRLLRRVRQAQSEDLVDKARARFEVGDLQGAIGLLNQVFRLEPENALARALMARVSERIEQDALVERRRRAVDDLEAAIERDLESRLFAEARRRLASALKSPTLEGVQLDSLGARILAAETEAEGLRRAEVRAETESEVRRLVGLSDFRGARFRLEAAAASIGAFEEQEALGELVDRAEAAERAARVDAELRRAAAAIEGGNLDGAAKLLKEIDAAYGRTGAAADLAKRLAEARRERREREAAEERSRRAKRELDGCRRAIDAGNLEEAGARLAAAEKLQGPTIESAEVARRLTRAREVEQERRTAEEQARRVSVEIAAASDAMARGDLPTAEMRLKAAVAIGGATREVRALEKKLERALEAERRRRREEERARAAGEALKRARESLERGDLVSARRELADVQDVPGLVSERNALARRLEVVESERERRLEAGRDHAAAVARAKKLLANGELEALGGVLDRERRSFPDDPALFELAERLAEARSQQELLRRKSDEVHALAQETRRAIEAGRLEDAEALLQTLDRLVRADVAGAVPGWEEIVGALHDDLTRQRERKSRLPATAEELRAASDDSESVITRELQGMPVNEAQPARVVRPSRRGSLIWVVGGASVLLIAIALAWSTRDRAPTTPQPREAQPVTLASASSTPMNSPRDPASTDLAKQEATGPEETLEAPVAELGTLASDVEPVAEKGYLVVDAVPWAEVLRIEDEAGHAIEPAGDRYTPLLLSLPPGLYTVQLSHPKLGKKSARSEVVAGRTSTLRVPFDPDVSETYFRQEP